MTHYLNLPTVVAAVTDAIKNCLQVAKDQAATEAEVERTQLVKELDGDMLGLRTLIIDNCRVLLPLLNPEVARQCEILRRDLPDFSVIISGTAPRLRALAVYGDSTEVMKVVLMFGENASTPTEALRRLLAVSMKLIQEMVIEESLCHRNYVISFKANTNAHDANGYYTLSAQKPASPLTEEDDRWWGVDKPSPDYPPYLSLAAFKSNGGRTPSPTSGTSKTSFGNGANTNGSTPNTSFGYGASTNGSTPNTSFFGNKNGPSNTSFIGIPESFAERTNKFKGLGIDTRAANSFFGPGGRATHTATGQRTCPGHYGGECWKQDCEY